MIKTMLLTAQLALSPIVGTNGLQPKRLPNPVYGEEVNLSVTYNGKEYNRLSYVNDETKWNATLSEGGYLTFSYKGIQFTGNGFLNSNIGSGDAGENYCSINKPDDSLYIDDYNGKFCIPFYTYAVLEEVVTHFYVEIISNEDNPLEITYYIYDTENGWEIDQATNEETTLQYKFTEFANNPLPTSDNVPLCTLGHIPQYQPTIANPSVYDNIYNFYYQNLFANDALDELGAEVGNNSMTMRQWLAHTATIVSISLLAVALAVLVIKIFKLIAGSISDIWG